jgi:hypothetical protein
MHFHKDEIEPSLVINHNIIKHSLLLTLPPCKFLKKNAQKKCG